eukprot:scaffold31844_cov112-Isochrysis_galbana.AAC.1
MQDARGPWLAWFDFASERTHAPAPIRTNRLVVWQRARPFPSPLVPFPISIVLWAVEDSKLTLQLIRPNPPIRPTPNLTALTRYDHTITPISNPALCPPNHSPSFARVKYRHIEQHPPATHVPPSVAPDVGTKPKHTVRRVWPPLAVRLRLALPVARRTLRRCSWPYIRCQDCSVSREVRARWCPTPGTTVTLCVRSAPASCRRRRRRRRRRCICSAP